MSIAQAVLNRERRLADLHARIRERIPAMRSVQVELGRMLLEVRRMNDFPALGATTFPTYCESVGLSLTEGRELVSMVEAAAVQPEVEARVLEGTLTPQKATVIHEIQKNPRLQEKGDDLIPLALSKSGGDFRDELNRRRDKARIGRPPVVRTMNFSAEENDAVDRTKLLVERMLDRIVTDGEAVGRACFEFLDRHDPVWKAERLKEKDEKAKASLKERPLPSGAWSVEDLERSRHIAEMTKREILRVAGDRCWVKDCPNRIFLEHCHRTPHRANGSTRVWNLLYLCREHHGGFDRGDWFLKRRSDGVWRVISRDGHRCGYLLDDVGKYLDEMEELRVGPGHAPP